VLIPTPEECFVNLVECCPHEEYPHAPFWGREASLTSNDTYHLLIWHASHTSDGLFFFVFYYVSCFPAMEAAKRQEPNLTLT